MVMQEPLGAWAPVPAERTGVGEGSSAVAGRAGCASGERHWTGTPTACRVGDAPGLSSLPSRGGRHPPSTLRGRSVTHHEMGSISPLTYDWQTVCHWVRTHRDARRLVAHAAWRTTPATAAEVVLSTTRQVRTPEPLRVARQVVRTTRAGVDPVG